MQTEIMQAEIVSANFDQNKLHAQFLLRKTAFCLGLYKRLFGLFRVTRIIYIFFANLSKPTSGFAKKQLKCRCIVAINVGE